MRIEELLDIDNLNELIAEGYIQQRRHLSLPLRILNYSPKCMFDNKWPLEVCLCRGLIVDNENNVVSRPLMKFFNLGQVGLVFNGGEPLSIAVDSLFLAGAAHVHQSPLTITRKLDGWAGILWHYGEHWGVASRGSFDSPGALYATEKFQKFVKYTATECIPSDYTLFFEIISKVTKVVVPYDWEGLCLLTAIDNKTGEEMEYDQLLQLWKDLNQYAKDKMWCRIVDRFDKSVEDCVADDDMREEGYVVAVNRKGLPPVRAKIKLAEYCRLHRILCGVTPQKIWAELADPMSPWLAHNTTKDWTTGKLKHDMSVPKDFAEWVRKWHNSLTERFHDELLAAARAHSAFRGMMTNPNLDRKQEEHNKWESLKTLGFSKETIKIAVKLYHGKMAEAYSDLWASVRPHGREDVFYAEGKGE